MEFQTINILYGLFRNNRLIFGVKSAPALFQEVMDATLTGFTGTVMLIHETQKEPFNRLVSVFERIQQYGFLVQTEKCQFFPVINQVSEFYIQYKWTTIRPGIYCCYEKYARINKHFTTAFSVSHNSSFLWKLYHFLIRLNNILVTRMLLSLQKDKNLCLFPTDFLNITTHLLTSLSFRVLQNKALRL